MNKQMETFSFNPPIKLFEEDKWLLTVTSFETTNSVFKPKNENKSFSTTTPGHWSTRGGAESIYKLQKLLELKSQNNIDLRVKEVRKTGNLIKIGEREYKSSGFESQKKER